MVSTSRPSAWPASIRQELTALPSTITVQAPQSPTSQPSLAPVRLKFSRSISAASFPAAPSARRLAVDGDRYVSRTCSFFCRARA